MKTIQGLATHGSSAIRIVTAVDRFYQNSQSSKREKLAARHWSEHYVRWN